MKWFKNNWLWLLINIIVLLPILSVFAQFRIDLFGTGQLISMELPQQILEMKNNPEFAGREISALGFAIKSTGEWSIRWLVACLSITPLFVLFANNRILRYRKMFGLYAFAYAFLHTLFFIAERGFIQIFDEFNFILGLISLLIMIALALTSNKWSMKTLGRNWKKLQKFVYAASILAVLHLMLIDHGGSWVLYAVIMSVGFVLRLPKIREFFEKRRLPRLVPIQE